MGKVTRMGIVSDGAQSDRARVERAALDHLAERMAAQFPELPATEIAAAIQGKYAQFEDSRIRDFVPVLVERSVRDELVNSAGT
jgi:hypothetical protein